MTVLKGDTKSLQFFIENTLIKCQTVPDCQNKTRRMNIEGMNAKADYKSLQFGDIVVWTSKWAESQAPKLFNLLKV